MFQFSIWYGSLDQLSSYLYFSFINIKYHFLLLLSLMKSKQIGSRNFSPPKNSRTWCLRPWTASSWCWGPTAIFSTPVRVYPVWWVTSPPPSTIPHFMKSLLIVIRFLCTTLSTSVPTLTPATNTRCDYLISPNPLTLQVISSTMHVSYIHVWHCYRTHMLIINLRAYNWLQPSRQSPRLIVNYHHCIFKSFGITYLL